MTETSPPRSSLIDALRKVVTDAIEDSATKKAERRGSSDPILDYLRSNASSLSADAGPRLAEFLRAKVKPEEIWGKVTDAALSTDTTRQRALQVESAIANVLAKDTDYLSPSQILTLVHSLEVVRRLADA